MNERTGIITFKGNPFTLVGPELKVGDKAPDFSVVDNVLAPVTLASYAGMIKIISSVPSIDTPVCDAEVRKFNQGAALLPGNVVVLTVSLDLPFAQKRWCGAAGIDRQPVLAAERCRIRDAAELAGHLSTGRPTLLILDDALVHSDAQRLAQMKRVIYDVAQRHQVLLFTCHPAHWRDLGAPARPIQAL